MLREDPRLRDGQGQLEMEMEIEERREQSSRMVI
jgi:hypothetical protein